jgi:hypothetical protein
MAASPKYKVYNPAGEYVACCKHAEDAACLVALYGIGASIRLGHAKVLTLYCEDDQLLASQSYDEVAERVHAKEHELHQRSFAKYHQSSTDLQAFHNTPPTA